ncbi:MULTISPECIES: antibiotic biosynthesis monooxygenase family protein [unclassified Streptomyces]|uniref:antibiotic biosynthesis monooxygenase family protein n=1 Tax=unclassified Streptomyces TaxID=2593676 RepID=UPI00203333F2|nr:MULTISPECIES: antibiotic biosynthesis monooxygenase family protein [unclassified Streptomyces]MCM2423345.1 antibiotic biosynthesis monooxygenase [Streptomyces sp. RKAG293]MCM2424444.1 antibiotic biosynthesis monooxygenase [Streptomyces sp. RKAG337]
MNGSNGRGSHSAPPFRVILRMEIHPGSHVSFEHTWLEVGRLIALEPTNLGQVLVRSVEEESVYYVITDWRDEPSFREFERSEAHVEHRRRLKPFRTGGQMILTQIVYDLGGVGAAAATA